MLANIFDFSHLKVTSSLFVFFTVLYHSLSAINIKRVLLVSVLSNCSIFFIALIYLDRFNFNVHLPLHLCYLTEIAIVASLFFNNEKFSSWVLLNCSVGAVVSALNSNLIPNSLVFERIYFYTSHFNLALFVLYCYRTNFNLTFAGLISSIRINTLVLLSVSALNVIIGSNYWFTRFKPSGVNLTNIFPDWPYYLVIMVSLGILLYYLTYIVFKSLQSNNVKRSMP